MPKGRLVCQFSFFASVPYVTLHTVLASSHVYLLLTGLLIGCGKKWEILRHFQGKLCGKKGPLCGKLCDFFKADLICFFRS